MTRYANCTQCPHHRVIPDPDPTDWFCDDDVAVVCTITKNEIDPTSRYAADRQEWKPAAISCRPYRAEQEATTPEWCPLEKESA